MKKREEGNILIGPANSILTTRMVFPFGDFGPECIDVEDLLASDTYTFSITLRINSFHPSFNFYDFYILPTDDGDADEAGFNSGSAQFWVSSNSTGIKTDPIDLGELYTLTWSKTPTDTFVYLNSEFVGHISDTNSTLTTSYYIKDNGVGVDVYDIQYWSGVAITNIDEIRKIYNGASDDLYRNKRGFAFYFTDFGEPDDNLTWESTSLTPVDFSSQSFSDLIQNTQYYTYANIFRPEYQSWVDDPGFGIIRFRGAFIATWVDADYINSDDDAVLGFRFDTGYFKVWCNKYDEHNYDVTLKVTTEPYVANFLLRHLVPGALREFYSIKGKKEYVDTTYADRNILYIKPLSREMHNLKEEKMIIVSSITSEFIGNGNMELNIKGKLVDSRNVISTGGTKEFSGGPML